MFKMNQDKFKIKGNIKVRNPQGKIVKGSYLIKKEILRLNFNNCDLAKQFYRLELGKGNKRVKYETTSKTYIEYFPNKSSQEIFLKIRKELRNVGGDIK